VRLCYDYDAEAAERDLKNRTGRLIRFVNMRMWTRSRNDRENIGRRVPLPDGSKVMVTVFLKEGR